MGSRPLSEIERRAEKAEELSAFSGVSLKYIREQVEHILALIGRDGLFDQYTKHDISHIDQMFTIAEWIIPEQTTKAMTHADWLMLVLAVYFHDMGMLVTKKEFDSRGQNPEFLKFKEAYGGEPDKNPAGKAPLSDEEERFLYQEYVRGNHAKRINCWINGKLGYLNADSGGEIVGVIGEILKNLPSVFKRDLGKICESHHLDDLDDFDKYSTCEPYGIVKDERVNLHYIAIILRTVDLLHITHDRTPSVQFRLINPTDSKSIVEWQKQQAVTAVVAKRNRDKDGNVDNSLPKDTIEVSAYFDQSDQAEAFFGLSAYIMFMQSEIRKCYDWVQLSIRKEGTKDYLYPWQKVDDEKIETTGFEPHKLSFTVDQDSILRMLVGHTLYNDSSVVIRELIQNGLDAVKLQYCMEHRSVREIPYIRNGSVDVTWNEADRCLTICDNGTGMTIKEVEGYLLTVGVSKYRTDNFRKEFPYFPAISRFGIGILTCFLIADDIDITTNSMEEETANIINLRKVNGKYLLKKVEKNGLPDLIRSHGTAITLHVRSDVDIDNILADAKKWVLFPPCKVTLDSGEGPVTVGYESPKEALTRYLNEHRYTVDDQQYTVVEKEKDGIILAYALEYNDYLKEWGFLTSRWISQNEDGDFSPVGSCIEGIRVEFSPPGYKESGILAVANTRNCHLVLTNVARSAIEDTPSTDQYLSILYELYAEHIQEQIKNLQNLGYSLSWAAAESKYLIEPLIQNRGYYNDIRVRLHNSNILQEKLALIKSIVLEENSSRKAVSAKEIQELDSVLVVDSEMVTSAESLLRQVKSDTTLLNILRTVQRDFDLRSGIPLFCNYDSSNQLHRHALSNKKASSISVNKKQRRIDIVFSSATENWEAIDALEVSGNRYSVQTVHVPLSDIEIEGITDELGVQTVDGLYLSGKNTLVQYVRGLLSRLNYNESADDLLIARTLMAAVSNNWILSTVPEDRSIHNLEDKFSSMMGKEMIFSTSTLERGSDLLNVNRLWTKVDKGEFLTKIFERRYTVYRLRDWSRGGEQSG